MLNMVGELLEKISLSSEMVGYRFLNLGGKVVYFIGFKSVVRFSPCEITFKVGSGVLVSIKGNDLSVKEMDESSVAVCGKIKSVEEV